MHRKYSFIPGSLGRFIAKNKISFDYLEVPPEMICRKRDHPGEKFFILTLRRPGGLILKIPYSQGAKVSHWPNVQGTLEMIASDAMTYLSNPTVEDYVASFGEDEDYWENAFEVLKSMTESARAFLGQEAFDELINMTIQGYELEGDTGWRRQRTCG